MYYVLAKLMIKLSYRLMNKMCVLNSIYFG